MKKVILGLVVMFGMMSCNNSKSVQQSKLDLLVTTAEFSSLSYNVEVNCVCTEKWY